MSGINRIIIGEISPDASLKQIQHDLSPEGIDEESKCLGKKMSKGGYPVEETEEPKAHEKAEIVKNE